MSKIYDAIIVGQGLAGSLLTYKLLERGSTCLVIDRGLNGSSSRAASGIINPITGRQFVKSWLFDVLLEEAAETYEGIGSYIGHSVWRALPLYRTLYSEVDHNRVTERSAHPSYTNHLKTITNAERIGLSRIINEDLDVVQINAFHVEASKMLDLLRARWIKEGILHEGSVDVDAIVQEDKVLKVGGFAARRVILCQGFEGNQNKFFNALPIVGYQGTAALLRGLQWPDFMLKKRQFVVPSSNGVVWFGSISTHNIDRQEFIPENEIRLEEECFKLFKNKPLQKTFLTGVRPTTPDRRPFLGQSSDQPGLFILNGLGTKGLSLAPYLSKVLIQWMDFGIMPPPEIVASRFLKGS